MRRFAVGCVLTITIAAFNTTNAAFADCFGCYVPATPCITCYQQYAVPPQYRTVYSTVMVSPGQVIQYRTPPRYGTVYETIVVPRTVEIEPEHLYNQLVPPQFATVPSLEMVAPGQTYYVPVQPTCSRCGW